MSNWPDRNTWRTADAGQAPCDIGRPQPAFLDVADQVSGAALDAGYGTGENALCFASRGHPVPGIDFLAEPILRAQRKAVCRSRGGCPDPALSQRAPIIVKIPDTKGCSMGPVALE